MNNVPVIRAATAIAFVAGVVALAPPAVAQSGVPFDALQNQVNALAGAVSRLQATVNTLAAKST